MKSIKSSHHRILERSAAEAVAYKLIDYGQLLINCFYLKRWHQRETPNRILWEAFGSHLGELETEEPLGGNLDLLGGIWSIWDLGSLWKASGTHQGSIHLRYSPLAWKHGNICHTVPGRPLAGNARCHNPSTSSMYVFTCLCWPCVFR